MSKKTETRTFEAEAKQLLHLMVHSLYSNKEIFLRELISNASDAADRLRFEALSKPELLESAGPLQIRIEADEKAGRLSIHDNGIGMSRDEVISNLGTIAKSGTAAFLKTLTGDKQRDMQLIGQFGVGFYSAFIVADEVEVLTRRAGSVEDSATRWRSGGEAEYSIEAAKRDGPGTTVTLKLKTAERDFADSFRLRSIIKKYADHISIPVMMEKMGAPGSDEGDSDKQESAKIVDMDGKEIKSAPAAKEYEAVNEAKALWARPRKEVKDEEYKEFYKHISHDFNDPLDWSHNKVEGKLEYTSLLYVPASAPFDLWNRDAAHGLKLYVQRVFIMDDAAQFLPLYLRFMRGVVDSNDISLNVSREILQQDPAVESMRAALCKRALDMLDKLRKKGGETYQKFWREFGQVLKEGPVEDFSNRERIAGLLLFHSTASKADDQDQSLTDYIARMKGGNKEVKDDKGDKDAKKVKESADNSGASDPSLPRLSPSKPGESSTGQDKIYYLIADSLKAARGSPHLEIFRKKGIEVLLLVDRIDEWLMGHLREFDGKQFHDISRGELDLDDISDAEDKARHKASEEKYKDLIARIEKALEGRAAEVRLTHRLTDSPACLAAAQDEPGMQMRRILEASGQTLPETKPIFEVNPTHPLIEHLDKETDEARFTRIAGILFDQAHLADGRQLEDPTTFCRHLNELLLELK